MTRTLSRNNRTVDLHTHIINPTFRILGSNSSSLSFPLRYTLYLSFLSYVAFRPLGPTRTFHAFLRQGCPGQLGSGERAIKRVVGLLKCDGLLELLELHFSGGFQG